MRGTSCGEAVPGPGVWGMGHACLHACTVDTRWIACTCMHADDHTAANMLSWRKFCYVANSMNPLRANVQPTGTHLLDGGSREIEVAPERSRVQHCCRCLCKRPSGRHTRWLAMRGVYAGDPPSKGCRVRVQRVDVIAACGLAVSPLSAAAAAGLCASGSRNPQ